MTNVRRIDWHAAPTRFDVARYDLAIVHLREKTLRGKLVLLKLSRFDEGARRSQQRDDCESPRERRSEKFSPTGAHDSHLNGSANLVPPCRRGLRSLLDHTAAIEADRFAAMQVYRATPLAREDVIVHCSAPNEIQRRSSPKLSAR